MSIKTILEVKSNNKSNFSSLCKNSSQIEELSPLGNGAVENRKIKPLEILCNQFLREKNSNKSWYLGKMAYKVAGGGSKGKTPRER